MDLPDDRIELGDAMVHAPHHSERQINLMSTTTKTACTCPKANERVVILSKNKAMRMCEVCGHVKGPMFTAADFLRAVVAEAIEAEEFQDSLSEA